MSAQRLFLHVGLPKSGTTYVQGLLASNRAALKEHGFIYPFIRAECMFHAAVELRRLHRRWRLDPAVIDGTWQQLLDRVRQFGGTGIISHELLAGAREEAVARVVRDTSDFEVHLVVTARDVTRQASAHWQETVKNGDPWSFAEFADQMLTVPPPSAREGTFWRGQDLGAVLRRWAPVAAPEHVHLVTVPRPEGDRTALWRRFADALDLDASVVDPALARSANESLGTAEVALLRQVLVALDGRLREPHYAHVVKRFFSQRVLSQFESARPVTPEDVRLRLDAVVEGWATLLAERGHRVHGDVDELRPAGAPPDARDPDDVPAEELVENVPGIIAELLVEIATLRTQVEGGKRLPPLPDTP
jgi:hypothetical protein